MLQWTRSSLCPSGWETRIPKRVVSTVRDRRPAACDDTVVMVCGRADVALVSLVDVQWLALVASPIDTGRPWLESRLMVWTAAVGSVLCTKVAAAPCGLPTMVTGVVGEVGEDDDVGSR